MLSKLFDLRAELPKNVSLLIEIFGFIFLVFVWGLITYLQFFPPSLLPSPFSVLTSFYELHFEDRLIRELFFSVKINILGYIEAILISLPIGFCIGLFPFFREMFKRYIDSLRFLPLSALTGVFISWWGIDSTMKVQFLTCGITVYLIPLIAQRVNEVDQTFVDTFYTLGASKWQMIKHVFIPDVFSKTINDIRVIISISWTYIIIAEMLNRSEGGIGSLTYMAARQGRIDKVFALLVIIICIGFLQDKVMMYLDRILFPYKNL